MNKPTTQRSITRNLASLILAIFTIALAMNAPAADLFWDANGATAGTGGTGNWLTAGTWRDGSAVGSLVNWSDGSSATFPATSANTLNGNVVLTAITNTGGNATQIVGSGANTIDFGAGGFFVGGGNTLNMRSSALFKGNVTLIPTSGTLAQAIALWIKADNTEITSFTLAPSVPLAAMLADHAGAFGPAATSTLLITNRGIVNLGAQASEVIGNLPGTSNPNGISYNAVPTTIGSGYIRSRFGTNIWNGPITLTADDSGFITRGASTVLLRLASTATVDLGNFTLQLNIDSASAGMFFDSVISGSGNLITVGPGTVTSGANGTGTTRLSAANTFTGTATTAPNLGTLALNHVNALQNATLDTGATAGSQQVTFVLAGNNTYNLGALTGSDALAIGGNTISVGAKAVDTAFSAAISGAGGSLTKVGVNKLTLDGASTYDGVTTVNSGTLALGASGSLAAGSTVSIAAGATFDTSAQTTYTHGSSAALIGNGTGTTVGSNAAEILGGTTVDLGSRPVTLNFTPTTFTGDATHPSLYISAGSLTINGGITVVNNGAAPLGAGTYVLIAQASGTITGTPTLSGTVGGQGLVAGHSAIVQVSGGNVELVVQAAAPTTTTLTRNISTGSSTTYGDTLQFDVSVSSALATGTVELRDGGPLGTLIGSATLVGGAATITPADNAVTAGVHANIVALYLGDVNYSGSTSAALAPAQNVATKTLTVSGTTAQSKYFDTTAAAVVSGGSLVGVLTSDLANVTLNESGVFASAGPGTGISVTATSTLGGSASANYSLTQPTGLTADIYASGVWTGAAADTLWNTAGNWSPAGFPSGANVTADFSTLDITASQTVNLNSARTIGHLIFGDTDTGTAANWTVANNGGGGNILTLAGTKPTVTVNALGDGARTIISAVVAGSDGLNKAGSGALSLNGANTFSGGLTVSNGTVNINADNGLGVVPGSPTPGNIVLDNGGTLAMNGANQSITSTRGLIVGAAGGTLLHTVTNSGNLTYPGVATGPGTLTLSCAPLAGIIMSGQNTYSGGTILNGYSSSTMFVTVGYTGTPGNVSSGPFGTGSVTFNGAGTRSSVGADTALGNPVIFAANATFPNVSGEKTLTLEGPVTLSGDNRVLTVNIGASVPGKSLTIAGSVNDGGNAYSLTKAGTGTLVLSASNSYTGGTIISGGVLTVSNELALSSGPLTIATGAARLVVADGLTFTNPITINGGGASFRGLIENSGTNNATVSGPAITINSAPSAGGHFGSLTGGSLTIASAINSSVSVSLRTGTGFFSGGGSYNDMSITGTGILGTNNGLSTTATLDIGLSGAATFDMAGFNQTLAGIKRTAVSTAAITNSSASNDSTLTLTGTSSYPGVITDASVAGSRIALVVNGGNLTLSGANTYSGGTTVTNGTLTANVSTATGTGAVAIQNAATLTGDGTVLGALTVDAGGTFVPGLSIALGETFTAGSTVALAGSTVMQIGNNGSPASDQVVGVTDINYGGALVVTNLDNSPLSAGDVFTLFSASGTKTGNFSSVTVLPASMNLNGTFDPSTGQLTLSSASVAPIPLDVSYGGGSLTFSWTNASFKLQSQTNTLGVGISTNWGDYPGGGSSPVNVPVDAAQGAVFFRLTTP
jgi:fibronectin-binding autotransporter adhesin